MVCPLWWLLFKEKRNGESLNRDYNGIVNFLEFYQLCDLRDSLNKYIALYQQLEKENK